jgi:hypothetical protein
MGVFKNKLIDFREFSDEFIANLDEPEFSPEFVAEATDWYNRFSQGHGHATLDDILKLYQELKQLT